MLKHRQSINGQFFYPIVLPRMLIGHILELSHNKLGHNRINRTYAMLKRLYYWKGMKIPLPNIFKIVTTVKSIIFK